jgi:hypothetical protein
MRKKKIKCEGCGEYSREKTMNLHNGRYNRELKVILLEITYKRRLTTHQHNNNEENLDI